MTESRDPLEILSLFEGVVDSGGDAESFWTSLRPNEQTLSLLEDLLLVELEKRSVAPGEIGRLLDVIERCGGSSSYQQSLVSGAFEIWDHLKVPVRWEDCVTLPAALRPFLKLERDPFPLGMRLAGGYEIQERIGAGGFGVVYRVRDLHDDRVLACKTPPEIDESLLAVYRELFENEAEAMHRMVGSGCPADYELLNHDGHPLLMMEYIDGPSLRERLKREVFEPYEAARVLASVAGTLAEAHRHRIVHRDLKPENVLLDDQGNVYVMDFGLVLFGDESQLDREGEIAGTRGYMPPDALLGAANEMDGRADIYAVGIMLFEMLTGEFPGRTTSREEALVAAIGAASVGLPWPADAPEQLQAIAAKCVQANPLHRYASAIELASELEAFCQQVTSLRQKNDRLFAWECGLLFGKFSHMYAFADSLLGNSAPQEAGRDDLQLAIGVLFGIQEAAGDLRTVCESFAKGPPSDPKLLEHCTQFPKAASEAIRSALYGHGRGSDPAAMRIKANELAEWVSACFDSVQANCQSCGTQILATLEFAVVTAQSESPMREPFGNVGALALKTELPEALWERFVECCKEPTTDELAREFQRLKLDVGQFLRHPES